MNESQISPDDPRLTAYALGELEGDERAAVEAALRHDAAARALVEEIRATAVQLQGALEAEAAEDTITLRLLESEEGATGKSRGWAAILRFPQAYYIVGGLAAACLAVFIALRPSTPPATPLASPVAITTDVVSVKQAADAVNESAERETPIPELAVPETNPALAVQERPELTRERSAAIQAATAPVTLGPPKPEVRLAAQPPVVVPPAVALSGKKETASDPATATPPVPPPPAVRGPAETRIARSQPRAPGEEEIVTLSPFEVAVDRDSGATAAVAMANARSDRRGNRVALPAAPRGARFAAADEPEMPARDNEFLLAAENPLSGFSPEVETASYGSTRRFIESGRLPPRDAVRIEELVNYFPYRYAPPSGDAPFAAELVVTEAPWAPEHRLVRIALKGREGADVAAAKTAHMRAPANLVFLIDVSTSMKTANKLSLAQEAIRRLVTRLRSDDRVAIVTYSGSAGLVLPSIPASRTRDIDAAIDGLVPDHGTSDLTGLPLAYNVARANFVPNGLNRVILCTDGDFNLGVANEPELLRLVANRAQFGISLSVLGLGMGEGRHAMVPALAREGKGRFGYIETRAHAERLLAAEIETSLITIARDVKVQVEFNPAKVARYRLIGYENRALRREDFNDDRVDGAEIGAGHTLTALYEIVPHGVAPKEKEAWAALEDLRYGHLRPVKAADGSAGEFDPLSNELLTVKVRYKTPDGLISLSRKLEFPLTDRGLKFAEASGDFKFAAAVAGFGMVLRNSPYRGTATMGDVVAWASTASAKPADDPGGFRREFIGLAQQAETLLR